MLKCFLLSVSVHGRSQPQSTEQVIALFAVFVDFEKELFALFEPYEPFALFIVRTVHTVCSLCTVHKICSSYCELFALFVVCTVRTVWLVRSSVDLGPNRNFEIFYDVRPEVINRRFRPLKLTWTQLLI